MNAWQFWNLGERLLVETNGATRPYYYYETPSLLRTLAPTWPWLAGVGALGLILFLAWKLWKQPQVQAWWGARQLFAALCQAHGLSGGERRRLRRLAAEFQLHPAALVFVQPKLFESRGNDYPAADPRSLAALRIRLFEPRSTPNAAPHALNAATLAQ
jgi:hypothetical protein